MAKRIVLILLLILLIFILVVFGVDLYHYEKDPSPYRTLFKPRLQVENIRVNYLNANKTTLHLKMDIFNPLPFNFNFDTLEYKVNINEVELIKSTYAKSIHIRKWDSTWIDIPVTFYPDSLAKISKEADREDKDSVNLLIRAKFRTHLPFRKIFNLEVNKKVHRIYVPSARVINISYDSLSLKGVNLYIKLMILNRNVFPLKVKDLKYRFELAENPWVKGVKQDSIIISRQDSTEVTLPLHISSGYVFKTIGPILRQGGKVGYRFGMSLKLVSESNIIKNSEVNIVVTGTLKELIELKKDIKENKKKNGTS